ncbi:MAG: site-specific integrase, partial [Kiloniellales bacterium]|nr:site-specific integrase [Kiloniellales bacterium]
MLREASEDPELAPTIAITRMLALTGCRRGEILGLKWSAVDFENSCLRLADSKEGASTRPVGLPVIELLEERREAIKGEFVFPGVRGSETFGSFPNQWNRIFGDGELPDFTAHILRHSFASTANDVGFTESTIAALVGHSSGSITSKHIHSLDSVLTMAADTVSGYIQGLLARVEFKRTTYALDRTARHFQGSSLSPAGQPLPLHGRARSGTEAHISLT